MLVKEDILEQKTSNVALKPIYSFDIFDTIVTRKTAIPTGIFAIMQEKMKDAELPASLKENFYEVRTGTEALARSRQFRLTRTREISLENIYEMIQANYNLTEEQINYLKSLELETEKKSLVKLPLANEVDKLIKEGKKVVFISDMYLSAKQIHYLIDDLDCNFKDVKIYVSSETGVPKLGGLFDIVSREEQADKKSWIHYGDNYNADINSAKMRGISAIYKPALPLKKYQQFLINCNPQNASNQLNVGISRLQMLNFQKRNMDKYIFGAGYTGPILYNYVQWILDKAVNEGFKNLYFVSRDGFLSKIVADIIIEVKKLNIQTKYIYGSRKVWYLPSENNYSDWVSHISGAYPDRQTLDLVSYLSGIPGEYLQQITGINDLKLKLEDKDRVLLKSQLLKDDIKKNILELQRERIEKTKLYLKQVIDFSEDNIAFVDVQGSGYSVDYLSMVMNEIKDCTLWTFYLKNSFMEQKEKSRKLSYCINGRYDLLLELICKTNQGQTLSYEYDENGNIVPVTESINKNIWTGWGYDEYLQGIKSYVYNRLCAEQEFDIKDNSLDLYNKYATFYHKMLDAETAEIIGSIPHGNVGLEKNITVCAPKYHTNSELKAFILGQKESPTKTDFPHISILRSSKKAVKMKTIREKYHSLPRFILEINIDKAKKQAQVTIFGHILNIEKLLWRKK